MMTEQDIATLRAEFPEIPAWIVTREGMTLAEADGAAPPGVSGNDTGG
jgi:hypothetical protein